MRTNLQGLRALAAVGVVVFHVGLLPATAMPFRIGAAGVDLFFVLSGYIIAYSATRNAQHFLAHRLIRVIPAYWIATILAALFTLQAMDPAGASGWLIQSLFYLPGPGGRPALIFVGWTLVYELAFYLLYWIALRFGTSRAPIVALAPLVALALVPVPRMPGPWPLLLEFALGLGIYLLAERGRFPDRLAGPPGLLLSGAGLILLLAIPRLTGYDPDDYQSLDRVLCWGLPATAIILGLVAAERGGLAIRSKLVLRLGAASYAIYLLHPIAIGQLLWLAPERPPVTWLLCLLATAVTVAIAVGFHMAIEAPLVRRLRRLMRDRPPVAQRTERTA